MGKKGGNRRRGDGVVGVEEIGSKWKLGLTTCVVEEMGIMVG